MTTTSTPPPAARPAGHRAGPVAVFSPPADPADRTRMLRAHAAAARTLHVRANGPSIWGFQGRALSRRAEEGQRLRVVSAPLDKPRGITWDGPVTR